MNCHQRIAADNVHAFPVPAVVQHRRTHVVGSPVLLTCHELRSTRACPSGATIEIKRDGTELKQSCMCTQSKAATLDYRIQTISEPDVIHGPSSALSSAALYATLTGSEL